MTDDYAGNLTGDGVWSYEYDPENRLIKMASTELGKSMEFTYDYVGRRATKTVWDNASYSGTSTEDIHFVYHGWNLIAELDGSQKPQRDKQALLEAVEDPARLEGVVESEASELREFRWKAGLDTALMALGKTRQDLLNSRKSAPWKVATARYLTPNRWIAEHLKMGAVSSVQSLVSRHRQSKPRKDPHWQILKNHGTLD